MVTAAGAGVAGLADGDDVHGGVELSVAGIEVIEVARPNRQVRRRFGKTDVVDAIAAARAVLSGEATGIPKSHDGPVEALRTLKAAQRSGGRPQICGHPLGPSCRWWRGGVAIKW